VIDYITFLGRNEMNKKLIAVAVAGALVLTSGCSMFDQKETVAVIQNPLEAVPDVKQQEVAFLEDHGKITLEFDENGAEWLTIESTGTSPINFNHANSREEAFLVASMRARANLVEFLNNSVKTEKFTEHVSKTILNDKVKNGKTDNTEPVTETDIFGDATTENQLVAKVDNIEERNRATKVAQQVRQTINESSNGILKGAVVSKRAVDIDVQMVAVTVRVSKKTINAAQSIRAQIDGV
jgi:hypothetical protein